MAQKTTITILPDIKNEIEQRVNAFNNKHQAKIKCEHYTNIKGKFIYLMRKSASYGTNERVCRLSYNGDLKNLHFAIFKWSSETYNSDEIFFPGYNLFDGTIEGAIKAGLKAYPI